MRNRARVVGREEEEKFSETIRGYTRSDESRCRIEELFAEDDGRVHTRYCL